MTLLDLDPDQLLTTTRAVRKRLDFSRDVPDDLIRECVAAALQAPSGSNEVTMRFVVVKDAEKRAALGAIYAQCWAVYASLPVFAGAIRRETEAHQAQQDRVTDSATYLSQHFAESPVIVIGCAEGARADGVPAMMGGSIFGNILPAMWSFMLAARGRGLGTSWTTIHLMMEQQVADLLGIPFATVQQACMTPLAFTKGTDFKPAVRPDPDAVIRWDGW
jgi:nitroreductase